MICLASALTANGPVSAYLAFVICFGGAVADYSFFFAAKHVREISLSPQTFCLLNLEK